MSWSLPSATRILSKTDNLGRICHRNRRGARKLTAGRTFGSSASFSTRWPQDRYPYAVTTSKRSCAPILNEDPEPITCLRTGIPMELDHIVDKWLAQRADERYQELGRSTGRPPGSQEKH